MDRTVSVQIDLTLLPNFQYGDAGVRFVDSELGPEYLAQRRLVGIGDRDSQNVRAREYVKA